MSTGDELQDLQGLHASTSGDFSGIYDTNRPSLTCLLKSLGYEVIDLGIVKDESVEC
jgi:gephyrin